MVKQRLRKPSIARSSLNASPASFRSRLAIPKPASNTDSSSTWLRSDIFAQGNAHDDYQHKPYVILADDDDVIAIFATQLLQQVGLHPKRCVDGNEAFDLACFASETPDIILMDLNMPDMDGISSTRLIRDFYEARGLLCPVIIGFTSLSDSRSLRQMRSAGVVDFLPKPPTLQDIRRVVLPRIAHLTP